MSQHWKPSSHRPIHHRKYGVHLLILSLLYALTFLLLFNPWDGTGAERITHFSRIPSLILDGDLELSNDFLFSFQDLPQLEIDSQRLTVKGYLADFHAFGSSLFQAPFWILAQAIHLAWDTGDPSPRFALVHRIYVGFASVLAGFSSLLLCWRLLSRFVPPGRAMMSAMLTFFGSGALLYSLILPGHSAIFSLFSTTLFIYFCFSSFPTLNSGVMLRLGASAGLMLLTDWLTFPLLLIPIFIFAEAQRKSKSIAQGKRRLSWGPALALTPLSLLAMALVFSLQLFLWHKLYGKWIVFPAGEEISHWTAQKIASGGLGFWNEALFSGCHGLFSWYPILAISCVGLILSAIKKRSLSLLGLCLALIGGILPHCLAIDWGTEIGLGPRSLLSLLPIFAIGLAHLLHNLSSRIVRFIVLLMLNGLVFWNLFLSVAQSQGMVLTAPLSEHLPFWGDFLAAGIENPLRLLGRGLVMRFFTQGPAPLEPLLTLLAAVILIPFGAWAMVRYLWPILKRRELVPFFVFLICSLMALLDYAIWQSQPYHQTLLGHQNLRRLIPFDSVSASSAKGNPADFQIALDKLMPRYFGNSNILLHLARQEILFGQSDKAAKIYKELVQRGYPAGSQGLLCMGGKLDAGSLRPLESQSANARLAESTIRYWLSLNKRSRAQIILEQAFLPAQRHWLLMAEMAASAEDKEIFYRRTLNYHPVSSRTKSILKIRDQRAAEFYSRRLPLRLHRHLKRSDWSASYRLEFSNQWAKDLAGDD